jgi:Zn-dependent M32 family carboxypeptidase
MDTKKIEELKNSLSEIRETAEVIERKLEKFITEEDPQKRLAMKKLIESAINLLQFEFKRTMLLDTSELKDYFSDI